MPTDFSWFLAATGEGNPQTDPDASFIGSKSSTRVENVESTLTGVDGTDPDFIFTDSTESTDHTGSWILFVDGNNENVAREISAFNTGTGEYTLVQELPNIAVIGDTYQIYAPNGLFESFTNDQCLDFTKRSRLVYPNNLTGGVVTDFRAYVVSLEPGPLLCEIAMGFRDQTSPPDVGGMVIDEDEPDITNVQNFNDVVTNRVERFNRNQTFASAEFGTPVNYNDFPTFGPGLSESFYIRLFFAVDAPIPLSARSVFQIFIESTVSSLISSMLVIVDVPGADEEFFLGPERALRLEGGARVLGRVRSKSRGTLIPNKSINIQLTSGPGTLGVQSAQVSPDTGVPVYAVYLSPTNPVEVGNPVTFTVEAN